MSETPVNVLLQDNELAVLKAAVDVGEYASVNEVIREAVVEWQANHAIGEPERERLRELWDEGVRSGPGRPFDAERILAGARQKPRPR